jgi:hypothetical protein
LVVDEQIRETLARIGNRVVVEVGGATGDVAGVWYAVDVAVKGYTSSKFAGIWNVIAVAVRRPCGDFTGSADAVLVAIVLVGIGDGRTIV